MTDDDQQPEFPEIDPWVIPVSGDVLPPGSAAAGDVPPVASVIGPGSRPMPVPSAPYPSDDDQHDPSILFPPTEDELPTEGFHPRLRRSA